MPAPVADKTQFTTLVAVSQALAGTLNLEDALRRVLALLERHHAMFPSIVTLPKGKAEELSIAAAHGLTPQGKQARYRLGEGITGRAAGSGKPIIVPHVSHEPTFLNRAGERKNLHRQDRTFICVPVVINRKVVGSLGVDLHVKGDRDYDGELHFLQVVASMIAQAVNISHLIESETDRLRDENEHLRQELRERYDFSNIIGHSSRMRKVYEQITQGATGNSSVLIRGESGTGKELMAHAIHYNSARAKCPFVKVSCAAVPETLIETELFGHEKGPFSGTDAGRKGCFDLADGGTLFLDEIGDLSLATQVKLLRVLQEREFERLGGGTAIKANVRLITATNRDLETAITDGSFRHDLYCRLNVFSIFVPPLRERRDDVLLLADYFSEKHAREHRKPIKRISTAAIDMLASYHWPGNVRELENAIERAVLGCEGQVIHGYHLPPTLQTAEASGTLSRVSLSEAVDSFEKDLLMDALKTARGNRAKAAKLLGTTERIMRYKVKKYAIDCNRFRN